MFSTFFSNSQNIESAYPVIKETVPQSERGYNTNNKYPGMPPLMNDGRSITASWQPNATENTKIIEDNKITSNWQYRKYLTNNANDVMKSNFLASSNDNGYNTRPIDIPNIQSNQISQKMKTPHTFSSVLDNTEPFGFTNSDLKESYLTREQLYARKVSPVVTQENFIKKTVRPETNPSK
jgi:hypothetical protein